MNIVVPPPPATISSDSGVTLRFKEISIGVWDMSSSATLSVAHGLADITKVRGVSVVLRADDDSLMLNFPGGGIGTYMAPEGGRFEIDATNVVLSRQDFGYFANSALYNGNAQTRGYIHILYTT